MANNYQIGGWYNGQQWDGTRLGPVGQVIVGNGASSGSNQPNLADQFYKQASDKENQYIDSLLGQAGGQRDLALKQLDAQHKLALGNNDPATAQFLESIANKLESDQGRIQYDYNTYTNRENKGYGIQTGQVEENRKLALAKLAEDERAGTANINTAQGQGNQNTAESLNARGLATGVKTTGLTGGAPTTQQLGGFGGVGSYAQNANNTEFGNQRTALANSIGLGQQGANLTANQAQQNLGFAHTNTLADLTTGARRDAQDQQNTYTFGQQSAQQQYEQQKAALERQRQQLLLQDRQNSYSQAGVKSGVLGY